MIFMEIIGPLIITTLAGLSTVLGGLIVLFKIKNREGFISFALSFSASVMISLSIIDLIPSSFKEINLKYSFYESVLIFLSLFVVGVVLVNFINKKLNNFKNNNNYSLYKLGILSMIALALHNFPEGIATFMTSYSDLSLGLSLAIAIMMHNIPEGISIAVPLYYATGKKGKGILYSFISGLAEPLGAIVTYIFLKKYINMITISYVLILVAGIMISLAINELYPEAIKYSKKKQVNLGLLLGFLLVIINHIIF